MAQSFVVFMKKKEIEQKKEAKENEKEKEKKDKKEKKEKDKKEKKEKDKKEKKEKKEKEKKLNNNDSNRNSTDTTTDNANVTNTSDINSSKEVDDLCTGTIEILLKNSKQVFAKKVELPISLYRSLIISNFSSNILTLSQLLSSSLPIYLWTSFTYLAESLHFPSSHSTFKCGRVYRQSEWLNRFSYDKLYDEFYGLWKGG